MDSLSDRADAPTRRRAILAWAVTAVVFVAVLALAPPPVRVAAAIAAACLVLWLTEATPPFAPTLILLAVLPLTFGDRAPIAGLKTVIGWAVDPVLALFLGGLALARAAHVHGLDRVVAERLARARTVRRLALALMAGTAFLGMWMSNVAAAALVLAAVQPVLASLPEVPRRRVLVALAMGANLGGVATPIGSGPNGIAIAALADRTTITFTTWMGFAVPLAACLLAGTYLLLRPGLGEERIPASDVAPPPIGPAARAVIVLALVTITAWLTEPIHGVPSAIVALGLAAALFATRLLDTGDLREIDWSTLLLIAGGVTLGRVLEETRLLEPAIVAVEGAGLPLVVVRVALCALAAVLAALMSNTGTAALLVPVALRLDPTPTTALLVALATSLGVPFVISTPPNAMVAARGVPSGDLLRPGLAILIGGVIALALTGPTVLALFGLR